MISLKPTKLQNWLAGRIGTPQISSTAQVDDYQLVQLNNTLAHVLENSPYYQKRIGDSVDLPLKHISQINQLPFTTPADIQNYHLDMLCVSHGDVARIVTMHTSGTTSTPKRLYFSDHDLELNIDFLHHGLTCITEPGWNLLILLPGNTPDSVGDLLKQAAHRVPLTPYIHWPVTDLDSIVKKIKELNINCIAGAPAQVFALCRHDKYSALKSSSVKSVLLSTDYVPQSVVDEIRGVWGCRVFEHYGMTEMGLGFALECDAHQGYHLREADLLVEVIDPVSENPLGPGVEGEVVVTTLTRKAMPLIRYRTGDRAAWLETPCDCGSIMRRLGKIQGRQRDISPEDFKLSMPLLDETIMTLPGMYCFQASFLYEKGGGTLDITLFCNSRYASTLQKEVPKLLATLFKDNRADIPSIQIHTLPPEAIRWDSTGMIKRTVGTLT